jgi:hypothetical protein
MSCRIQPLWHDGDGLDARENHATVGGVQEARGRRVLIYVAEIESPSGVTATKQYEAPSIREVVRRVKLDLGDYPGFHLVHVNAISQSPGETPLSG